jgi:hypothetical protein
MKLLNLFLADVAVQKHDYLGALKTSQGQRTRDGRTAVQGVTHGQNKANHQHDNVLQRLRIVIDKS